MTTKPTRYDVFDPELLEAIEMLSDPAQTVSCEIVKGDISGKYDLVNAVFPPRDVHRDSVPVRLHFLMEGWIEQQLELMVMVYGDVQSGPYSLLGLMRHDQHQYLRVLVNFPCDYRMQFIGVNYNPVTREGRVFIPKDTYHLFEMLYSPELLHIRMRQQRKHGLRLSTVTD